MNLIKNGQFFDLGLSTTEYHRKNIIKTTIQELYEKFTIVLIYEYLDESLLLMKRKLCWQLDDIIYLKFHHENHNIWNRKTISPGLADRIRQWNQADTSLYEFFNKTLWDEIKYEGESFWKELKEFRDKLNEMESDCVNTDSPEDDRFILDEIPTGKRILTATPHARFKTYPKLKIRSPERFTEESSTDSRETHLGKTNIPLKFQNRTLKDLLMYSHIIRNASIDLSEDSANKFQNDQNNADVNNFVSLDLKQNTIQTVNHIKQNSLDPGDTHDLEGSGGHQLRTEKLSNSDRMLSKSASSWNTYFCKKLLMNELEYLDYFRTKHAYAKAASKLIK